VYVAKQIIRFLHSDQGLIDVQNITRDDIYVDFSDTVHFFNSLLNKFNSIKKVMIGGRHEH